MCKVIVYVAMSLDGYIADVNRKVSWLQGDGSDAHNKGSYPTFIKSIDTIILGYTTYKQIINELSPNNWVYKGKKSYVMTHKQEKNNNEVKFTSEDIKKLISRLKKEKGKNIWICGGANIINQFIKLDLIDVYHITVIPTLLGNGIRLFESFNKNIKLTLVSTESYNGIVDIVYKK